MNARYVYKGTIIGSGTLQILPQVGNYIEVQTLDAIFKVTSIMFKTLLSGDVSVMIYLRDIHPESEQELRNYK